jgi:hypothetical protein
VKTTNRVAALAAAMLLAGALSLGAEDAQAAAAASSSDDDALFGAEETVTQAATTSKEAEGQSDFLKYDLAKLGGSITGKAGFTSAWADPWNGNAELLDPDSRYITPSLTGKVTIVAKPSTDFGVNMDFRTSWPFATTDSFLTGASYNSTYNTVTTTEGSVTIPSISVWSLYSKFNWHDKVYFSFGKQPLAWGVSRGAFQPADDIFAVSSSIDLTDTTAEREGPISLKTTVPLSLTNNLYLYAGLPTDTSGATEVDPADARLAAKAEYGFGNTELALAGFYAYNDHPRVLLMGTTVFNGWTVFGESILKYGSERYYISEGSKTSTNALGLTGAQADDKFWFTGTAGATYISSDITVIAQYLFNGEGQTEVTAKEAYEYYILHSSEIDRIKLGTHYAFASLSESNLWSSAFGKDKLGASLIAIANLSDLSGYVMPGLSWTFFDYMILKLGATFSFGEEGDEYITYGVGQTLNYASLPTTPGIALSASLTIGTGSF